MSDTIVPTSEVRFLVGMIVVLCTLTVSSVVLITVYRPTNVTAIPVILGLMTPILMALLAVGLHTVNTGINGRVTQLINATAEREHVKGIVEGLIVNPNTSLQATDLPATASSHTEAQVREDAKLK